MISIRRKRTIDDLSESYLESLDNHHFQREKEYADWEEIETWRDCETDDAPGWVHETQKEG